MRESTAIWHQRGTQDRTVSPITRIQIDITTYQELAACDPVGRADSGGLIGSLGTNDTRFFSLCIRREGHINTT